MRWLLTIISLFALAISVSAPAWAVDETHLKKLKALNACVACDLSKAILVGANFSKADLRAAWFSNANLSRANLSGANLVVADLSGANLSGANLVVADLSGADLSGVNLGKASLHGANLSKAELSGADLWGANLSGVDLSTATLRNAKLDGAILCKTKMPWGEENSGCKKIEKTSKEPVCINRCVDTVGACARGKDMKPETCGAELTLCLKGC